MIHKDKNNKQTKFATVVKPTSGMFTFDFLYATLMNAKKNSLVFELVANHKYDVKIKLQIRSLDKLLCGGLRIRGITEICGEAGSGKTQICLHLCLVVQLPASCGGLGSKAIYISTEGPIPLKRLEAMAASMKKRFETKAKNIDFLNNIHCLVQLDAVSHIFSKSALDKST